MEKSWGELFAVFWVGLPAVIAAISSLKNGWKLNQAKKKLEELPQETRVGAQLGVEHAIAQRSARRFGEGN